MEREYFSHDYTARHDIKVKRLIAKHGMAGYGVYWAIVEDLYINGNRLPTDFDSISFDLRCDPSMVASVVKDFDLFTIDKTEFGSQSVGRRLDIRDGRKEKAKMAANKRWSNAGAMQTHSGSNASAMQTHSDGNAIKKEINKERKKIEVGLVSLEDNQQPKPRRQFQFDPNLPDGSGPMRWPHFGHYMTDGCPDEPFPDSDDDDIFDKNKWHWAVGIMCKYGRNLGTEGQCRHLARQMKHEKYQIQHAAKVIMNYRAFGRMEVLTHDEFKTYSTGPTGIDI